MQKKILTILADCKARSIGCPVCKGEKEFGWINGQTKIMVNENGVMAPVSGEWQIQLHFCPNCGREFSRQSRNIDGRVHFTKVFGYSDDVVRVENLDGDVIEINCYDSDVKMWFDDGSIIRISYGKDGLGVWRITEEKGESGSALRTLELCNNEDQDPYSDIFEIHAEMLDYHLVDRD